MGKKRRQQPGERQPAIGRGELADLHAQVKWYCEWKGCKPGSEGYSLMCQIGAALGNWPRVKTSLVLKIRQRTAALLGETAAGPARGPAQTSGPNPPRGWERCANCEVLVRAGSRHECTRPAPGNLAEELKRRAEAVKEQVRRLEEAKVVSWETMQIEVRRQDEAAADDAPRGEPRTVCGVRLSGYETPAFDEAVRRGELVIGPETPVKSALEEAWRRWCRERGQACRVKEVTWREVAESCRG